MQSFINFTSPLPLAYGIAEFTSADPQLAVALTFLNVSISAVVSRRFKTSEMTQSQIDFLASVQPLTNLVLSGIALRCYGVSVKETIDLAGIVLLALTIREFVKGVFTFLQKKVTSWSKQRKRASFNPKKPIPQDGNPQFPLQPPGRNATPKKPALRSGSLTKIQGKDDTKTQTAVPAANNVSNGLTQLKQPVPPMGSAFRSPTNSSGETARRSSKLGLANMQQQANTAIAISPITVAPSATSGQRTRSHILSAARRERVKHSDDSDSDSAVSGTRKRKPPRGTRKGSNSGNGPAFRSLASPGRSPSSQDDSVKPKLSITTDNNSDHSDSESRTQRQQPQASNNGFPKSDSMNLGNMSQLASGDGSQQSTLLQMPLPGQMQFPLFNSAPQSAFVSDSFSATQDPNQALENAKALNQRIQDLQATVSSMGGDSLSSATTSSQANSDSPMSNQRKLAGIEQQLMNIVSRTMNNQGDNIASFMPNPEATVSAENEEGVDFVFEEAPQTPTDTKSRRSSSLQLSDDDQDQQE